MENEATFVAPEGVYSLTDEQKPPPLHIPPGQPPPGQGQAYAKISSVTVKFPAGKVGSTQPFSALLNREGRGKDKEREKEKEKEKAAVERERTQDGGSLSSSDNSQDGNIPPDDPDSGLSSSIPKSSHVAFPFSPPQMGALGAGGGGRNGKKPGISRPKHNMRTTSSTFVTKLQSADGFNRIMNGKTGEVTFLFYNFGKSFYWTEPKAKDPLARITFSAFPTCHDVNLATASHERMDVVIGFNTGDLVWFDPISSRYVRINKQGTIHPRPCTSVHWVPGSLTLFVASFLDGSIIIFDKEREDGAFTPGVPQFDDWDYKEEMHVSMPPWHPASPMQGSGGPPGGKNEKVGKNPISYWKLGESSVVDFVFSPDVRYIAAVSEDGRLKVIDTLSERLVDTYASYFGALTCVAWSPDGRFIITGGQDDLVTVTSPWEQRVIARCQGHSSFVSSLAFDSSRCDGRTYRFASVGEDNKLIFWDFSSGALHRPKLQPTHHPQRLSVSSTVSLVLRRRSETIDRSTIHLPGVDGKVVRYHPAPSRNDVAILQPVLVKQVEGDILSAVIFHPSAVFIITRTAHLKVWVRPLIPTRIRNGRKKAVKIVDVDDL